MKIFGLILFLSLVSFPFGQLPRVSLGFLSLVEVRLHLLDFLVFGAVFSWLVGKLLKKEKFEKPSFFLPLLLFSGIAFLSLLLNIPHLKEKELFVSFLYLWRFIAYGSFVLVIFDFVKKDKKRRNLILESLIVIGTFSAIFSLIQYFFLPDIRPLEAFFWDPHYYRAVGTFLDPAFLGIILVLTLILITFRAWQRKNIWLLLAGTTTYFALALTYSRASYLAFLVASGLVAFFTKKPKFFIGALLLLGVTVFLLPKPGGEGVRLERESTIKARIINWRQSLEIIKENPFWGVGFNAYRYAQIRHGFLEEEEKFVSHAGAGADSSLLFVLATTGILGFLAYLWLWVSILKKNPLVLTSGVALLVHSFFSNSLFYPFVMFWWWLLVGSICCLSSTDLRKTSPDCR